MRVFVQVEVSVLEYDEETLQFNTDDVTMVTVIIITVQLVILEEEILYFDSHHNKTHHCELLCT